MGILPKVGERRYNAVSGCTEEWTGMHWHAVIKDYDLQFAADVLDAAEYRAAHEEHVRPWGHYVVLYEDARCKVKKLVVKPGHQTSLQRHLHRTERWSIVQGKADLWYDDACWEGDAGYNCTVVRDDWHRIKNTGNIDLVIIETQTGEYFGEDDIERKEDDYGRGVSQCASEPTQSTK